MITDVAGVRAGHWTDAEARTGCTVVLMPEGTVASAEVRGGAPASRELDLLAPENIVERIDAVLLTGGSAFGLAAADGVVRWCEKHGLGFPTSAGPVPIVPAMALFDLAVGDGSVRPEAAQGYAACEAATDGPLTLGPVGAAAGATVDKWRGPDHARPGGLGSATLTRGDLVVAALVAVNAFGGIDVDGTATSGVAAQDGVSVGDAATAFAASTGAPTNTTIGVIVTNARLSKLHCLLVAQGGHDGLARSIVPAHTRADGDGFVAAATGEVDAAVDDVRLLAVAAVEQAVRSQA